jgi:hypothetical protein
MLRSKEHLIKLLIQRLGTASPYAQRCLYEASEIVIFGSMSAGLDRPDSDIDVLCIGGRAYKLKTEMLDLIVVPTEATKNPAWLGGELASHVGEYGIWIKGCPEWKTHVHIGSGAIERKRRRISSFLRTLPSSWQGLQECFRLKYSVKLTREAQRLILLEQGVPVPPTRILDSSWCGVSKSRDQVRDRLEQLASAGQTVARATLLDDLLSRSDTRLSAGCPRRRFLRPGPSSSAGSTRKPFNPKPLISHLTNSNGCGNI